MYVRDNQINCPQTLIIADVSKILCRQKNNPVKVYLISMSLHFKLNTKG